MTDSTGEQTYHAGMMQEMMRLSEQQQQQQGGSTVINQEFIEAEILKITGPMADNSHEGNGDNNSGSNGDGVE